MDLPPHIDTYIKRSIEHSLGLAVPDDALRLKLLASEESRHRLRDRVFLLEDRLRDRERRLEQWKAEAAMSAQGLRRCVGEKEAAAARCAELESECALYDRDVERLMDSCDELAGKNEELRAKLIDASDVMALVEEMQSLKEDKEKLRVNLLRAEEEVKLLSDENQQLERENKKLLRRLKKERDHHDLNNRQSTSPSKIGKCKSCPKNYTNENTISPGGTRDSSRAPLSPLQQNPTDVSRRKRNELHGEKELTHKEFDSYRNSIGPTSDSLYGEQVGWF